VQLEDGRVVAARDPSGQAWASVGVSEYKVDASGALIYARDEHGNVWRAQASSEADRVVVQVQAELEAGSQQKPSSALSAKPSTYPRLLTHALVVGAILAPMSMAVASAQTAPIQQQRITIPLAAENTDLYPGPTTAELLRAIAAEPAAKSVVPAPTNPAPAAPPRAAAPTPRPMPPAKPTATTGWYFPWGYCTWWVAQKRSIPWGGNAIDWWPNARAFGFAEGSTPKVGAIMVTTESSRGHVAYVESVDANGGFTVSEMNYVGFGIVSQRHFNTNPGVLVGFIY
jgi:surface antigen